MEIAIKKKDLYLNLDGDLKMMDIILCAMKATQLLTMATIQRSRVKQYLLMVGIFTRGGEDQVPQKVGRHGQKHL